MPLSIFSPRTREWFREAYGAPTPVQAEGWPAIASGRHVLVSAPTGTGKTLTAFLYWLDRLARESAANGPPEGVQVLYLSPLKALGNDIRENLSPPLRGLGIEGLVGASVRTGDTPAAQRRGMMKRPPQLLITTPESLYLLLTSGSGRAMLRTARCVIVDELHALLDSKRGTHLSVSLERLDALCGRRLQRIALSATVRPLQSAADFLSGGRGALIVAPRVSKAVDIRVDLPFADPAPARGKSVWPALCDRALRLSCEARSTLAFVDGRAQAEKLAHGVNALAGGQFARTHHGCVSREQRLDAEKQLRSGELKLLCATSSMELGIDVGDIDLVLQIDPPATISSTLQRAGRAGHRPGRTSVMQIFPKTDAGALAAGLAARGALEGETETAQIPQMCLDVLAQHLVSMAAAQEYSVGEALDLFRGAWPYREIGRDTLESVLCMLAGDHEHEREVPARARVVYDRIHSRVSGDGYTRLLALSSGGTIPDRGWYTVTLADGTRLGELDEEFVFEARLGDRFLLGAFAWRILQITRDRVVVASAPTEGAQSPFWRGDGRGRPMETGRYFGELLRGLGDAAHAGRLLPALGAFPLSAAASAAAAKHIEGQMKATGCLPDDRTLIAEHFRDEAGEHQLMVHSVFGRRVNHALSMLLRHEASRRTGMDVRAYADDDGVLLNLVGGRDIPDGLLHSLDPDTAGALTASLLPAEPMFSISYRYAAARSLMIGARTGARQPLWVQRLRGAESLSASVSQPSHPLIREASRECLNDLLDLAGLVSLLRDLRSGAVAVRELHAALPSPMALPLRRQAETELMYESPIPSAALAAAQARALALAPDAEALSQRSGPASRPENAQRLHALLLAEGDLVRGEADVPAEWLEQLAGQGRAACIEPGLWIAAEQRGLYRDALELFSPEALSRVIRRCLRFRGPQDAQGLADRYALEEPMCRGLLESLAAEGTAVPWQDSWVHRDLFESAQRLTLSLRRAAVETAPPERFAALLARRAESAGPPQEQLSLGLSALCGLPLDAALWEEAVLPARAAGYRPGLLDDLLSEGTFTYRVVREGDRLLVSFHSPEAFDPVLFVPPDGPLGKREAGLLGLLETQGALFAHAICSRMDGAPVTRELQALAERGLVRQDSFAPVRQMLSKRGATAGRFPAGGGASRRWERARPLRTADIDSQVADAFRLCPILCRETCVTLPFRTALERLRVMEYTSRARRGYFVRGLSGAQFVPEEDFSRVTAFLAGPAREFRCLNAADPAQAWGRCLRHSEGRGFLCVPGTAVVTFGGLPTAVFERYGESLRVFDGALGGGAAAAFTHAFRTGRIFPRRRRVTVRSFPPEAREWLEKAGFIREMMDYALYR